MVQRKQTHEAQFPEKTAWPPLSSNSSFSARNLRKSDLGGVIFGCKHNTMEECLAKQLFGLPSPHFSYVRNIEEGLPLFLFNYSDRKLHGIFEAASSGRLNIDSYAWTEGGKQRTPFPAQVPIRIGVQCHPLTENQFKKVIEDNYYLSRCFWFELDHAQTRALILLFTSSPLPTNTRVAPFTSDKTNPLLASPATKSIPTSNPERTYAKVLGMKKDSKSSVDLGKEKNFESLGWDDEDFEPESSTKILTGDQVDGELECQRSCKKSPGDQDDGDLVHGSLSKILSGDLEKKKEPVSVLEVLAEDSVQAIQSGASFHMDGETQTLEELPGNQGLPNVETLLSKLKKFTADWQCSNLAANDDMSDNAVQHAPREVLESNRQISEEDKATVSDRYQRDAKWVQVLKELREQTENLEKKQFMVQVIKELRKQTEKLEKKQVEMDKEIQWLRWLVEDRGRDIQELNNRVKGLEARIDPYMSLDDSLNKFVEQYLGSEDAIYLIGGFNGVSWLSALDSFSPSLDILTPLNPMNLARSFASAVTLNGSIYVLGGGNGSSWYNTVERFNPRVDEWTPCPHLIRETGSLGGATLNGKIYAIGGGNGVECFSDVEMFDPALGRWITDQTMLQKRFAVAAADLHGALYAVGGYDGKGYLSSAERLDHREGFWTKVPAMSTQRGCHSLAVLNEKLYAMGGYDGKQMTSSVEIYDPRMPFWVMAEPLNFNRGYAAAAVVGDSLFVIGGLKNGENLVDVVESYKEGCHWAKTGLKAIGRRCFTAAVVL